MVCLRGVRQKEAGDFIMFDFVFAVVLFNCRVRSEMTCVFAVLYDHLAPSLPPPNGSAAKIARMEEREFSFALVLRYVYFSYLPA